MRAKLLVDKEIVDYRFASQPQDAVQREVLRNGSMTTAWFYPAGTLLEHPEAFWLVRAGEALPDDDECRKACEMNDEAIQRAIEARKKMHIHPADRRLYDAGLITGYNGDGSYELTETGKAVMQQYGRLVIPGEEDNEDDAE